jgi:hypothetical protein
MGSIRDRLNERGLIGLPVGYHKESNELMCLGEIMESLGDIRPMHELDQSQRVALVLKRWQAGGWSDMINGHELITMDRAIREVQANSTLGQELVEIYLRAIEMMLEDLGGA